MNAKNTRYAETPVADLEASSAAIEKQLAELGLKLQAMKEKAKTRANANDWSYACNLRKIESDLADILNFIN